MWMVAGSLPFPEAHPISGQVISRELPRLHSRITRSLSLADPWKVDCGNNASEQQKS